MQDMRDLDDWPRGSSRCRYQSTYQQLPVAGSVVPQRSTDSCRALILPLGLLRKGFSNRFAIIISVLSRQGLEVGLCKPHNFAGQPFFLEVFSQLILKSPSAAIMHWQLHLAYGLNRFKRYRQDQYWQCQLKLKLSPGPCSKV